ncbi:DUF421 domain-containing protein [Cytobacillus dafuensis]|uniref:DUF421 domain-containing protein n=1 Tax=Cytobacillus dafuensis TaxID=1742359 RepID=A0A5B8Z8C8_CYTDA|nr:YetF domain-containing protein [Cytobacillus dafuensis]QED49352.1 DUF421 domain-containing protein [Cytobacillus dafuensis]
MDFFHSQESLTAMQWILRALVAYFFLIIVVKVMGQRSISQLSLLDFAIALVIGNLIAHPLSDEQLGLKGSMITMSVLVILYASSVFITLKSIKLRRIVLPEPFPLIRNGQIMSRSLTKARISVDDLLSAARKEKIDDIKKISLALWEPDGTISFFMSPAFQTITRSDLNIISEPFDFPKTVVREGRVDQNVLKQIGKEENWLLSTLKTNHNAEISNVILATVDSNNQLNLFLYK